MGEGEEQGRKVNVLKGFIIGVLGNRGWAWVDSQTLPPPSPPKLHRTEGEINIYIFLKRSKKRKEGQGWQARREKEPAATHT